MYLLYPPSQSWKEKQDVRCVIVTRQRIAHRSLCRQRNSLDLSLHSVQLYFPGGRVLS